MKNKKIENKNLFGYTLAADAVEDYLAVQILMKNDHFLTAIQLSTTAVEKLFKSFINLMHHEKYDERIHKPCELYIEAKNYFKQYNLEFKVDFLAWLDSIYSCRYSSSLYPGKEITFGELHLLINLKDIFERVFTFYKQVNEEVASLYWNRTNGIKDCLENKSDQDLLQTNQKVISFLFVDGRKIVMNAQLTVYNPINPFIFRDAVVKDDILYVDLNVGQVTPLDLPPSFYSYKFKS